VSAGRGGCGRSKFCSQWRLFLFRSETTCPILFSNGRHWNFLYQVAKGPGRQAKRKAIAIMISRKSMSCLPARLLKSPITRSDSDLHLLPGKFCKFFGSEGSVLGDA